MKTILGDTISGEAEVRWNNLSSVSKLAMIRAKQRSVVDAKVAPPGPPKPPLWEKLGNASKMAWFRGARE